MRQLAPLALFTLVTLWPLAPAMAAPDALIVESAAAQVALSLFDIADIAVSESGGIAEIFVTVMPAVAARLDALQVAPGERLSAMICGLRFESAPMRLPMTGHIYLVQTTVMRGWALQELWQGTARCETLSPAVFLE